MKRLLQKIWHETDGALSFEWCVVGTLLVLGIVSGLSAARDGLIDELSDLAEAVVNLDQSFSFPGIGPIPESVFEDEPGTVSDCQRSDFSGQAAAVDGI